MNKKLRENFDNAFERFDFMKVRQVMRLLEWTWAGASEPPTVSEMENTVIELFEKASDNLSEEDPTSAWSTGGFRVKVHNSGNVSIEFIAEMSSVDWEE